MISTNLQRHPFLCISVFHVWMEDNGILSCASGKKEKDNKFLINWSKGLTNEVEINSNKFCFKCARTGMKQI